MKNFMSRFRTLLVIASVALLAACTKVPAGNVGVKFDLYGGDKGVTGEVVGPGKYWLGWNEEMYLFPTFSQNYTWVKGNPDNREPDESISFQDREGTQINADVGITYFVESSMADTVFQKFRKGIDEITDVYVRNAVRDALNSETSLMEAADIYGSGKEKLMERVTKRVKDQLDPIGVKVEKIYWVNAMRLPTTITAAINAKIAATQQAQQRENELQTATAQAQIEREKARGEADAKVIEAKGEAEANQLRRESISPGLIQYEIAKRWDGKLPQVTGENVPMLQLK